MTHICIGKLTIIVLDNGLSPGRRQAIIWINAGILLIGPVGTNFGEILIANQWFSFNKMHLKMSSGKWRPFCLGLNVLMTASESMTVNKQSGPWFNIKTSSYQYRKSHCGDKTVVRSSYLHNGISYTGKTTSLYWIRALDEVDLRCHDARDVSVMSA